MRWISVVKTAQLIQFRIDWLLFRLKEKEINDCSSIFSQRDTSESEEKSSIRSCGNSDSNDNDDKLRVMLLKRRMHEKYPHCFPSGSVTSKATDFETPQNGRPVMTNYDYRNFKRDREICLANMHIVTYDSNDVTTESEEAVSNMSQEEYYSRYIIAPRSVQCFTGTGKRLSQHNTHSPNDDSASNFYEVIE